MLTGNIRNQVDQIWNAAWSGRVSNSLAVIEQLTFLMFIKRLDDLHTAKERIVEDLGRPMTRRPLPKSTDDKGGSYDNFHWSRFRQLEARAALRV